jgi:hypothetical protein
MEKLPSHVKNFKCIDYRNDRERAAADKIEAKKVENQRRERYLNHKDEKMDV